MTREEAIKVLESELKASLRIFGEKNDKETQDALRMAIEALKDRPHGKWEFVGDNLFKCTHCGYIANGDYLRDWKAYTYDAEFPTACPKCGADMRKRR